MREPLTPPMVALLPAALVAAVVVAGWRYAGLRRELRVWWPLAVAGGLVIAARIMVRPPTAGTATGTVSQEETGGCAMLTITPSVAPPAPASTAVQLSASATCDSSTLEFKWWTIDFLAPDATWTAAAEWGPGASYTWDTVPLAPGLYGIAVWVREPGSTAAFAATSAIMYRLTAASSPASSESPG